MSGSRALPAPQGAGPPRTGHPRPPADDASLGRTVLTPTRHVPVPPVDDPLSHGHRSRTTYRSARPDRARSAPPRGNHAPQLSNSSGQWSHLTNTPPPPRGAGCAVTPATARRATTRPPTCRPPRTLRTNAHGSHRSPLGQPARQCPWESHEDHHHPHRHRDRPAGDRRSAPADRSRLRRRPGVVPDGPGHPAQSDRGGRTGHQPSLPRRDPPQPRRAPRQPRHRGPSTAGGPDRPHHRQRRQRLGGRAVGLAPWETHELTGEGGSLLVTATPGRHAGDVIGFLLQVPGEDDALYISGDTVYYDELDEIGRRCSVGTALLHFGAAVVPYFGDDYITMDGEQGARLTRAIGARTVVPVHFDAWDHFTQGRAGIMDAFTRAGLAHRLHWLDRGTPTVVDTRPPDSIQR
ncbi:MBL fold metallo-hydrolase [Streptomyces sp. NPDC047829]|uniref:MBL fold metallo-hydrolase n=1 Tax=Streptomyces sp. NPDC047829 TaxID=3154609 RepID=UPI0033F512A0